MLGAVQQTKACFSIQRKEWAVVSLGSKLGFLVNVQVDVPPQTGQHLSAEHRVPVIVLWHFDAEHCVDGVGN